MAGKYVSLYHSYLKSIEPLNDTERGRLFTAILEYGNTGAEPELRGNERFIFPTIREQIDRDNIEYEKKCEQNRQNVLRRYTSVYDELPKDTKATKEKEKEKEKENTGVIGAGKPPIAKFVPPTVEEVAAHCQAKGYHIDPEGFVAYYATQGWELGNGRKMKDWKAATVTWHKRESESKKPEVKQFDNIL